MIEAQNLTKYYGTFQAIEDVSFDVGKGEIVGFLGPNGAGKTTTMRILTGFLPPSSGRALIAGHDVLTDSLNARKSIGYLPETVPLYRDMTVQSYLNFFGSIRGISRSKRKARVKEVMGICRVDGYAKTQIGKLSKGYRQLVGVAQAVLHEPEVLILDEPTIGIDPRQVVQIRDLIKDLGKTHTVILSSHILPEISMLCERVIIMDQGKIVAVDRADNLSKKLKGGQRIELEIKGPSKDIVDRLESLEGVYSVKVQTKGKKQTFIVECTPGQDIRDNLSQAVVSAGFSLMELKTQEMSLEDIFLKLTTTEKG